MMTCISTTSCCTQQLGGALGRQVLFRLSRTAMLVGSLLPEFSRHHPSLALPPSSASPPVAPATLCVDCRQNLQQWAVYGV